jgi:hypothetical protein
VNIIAAAYVLVVNKNLGNATASVSPIGHFTSSHFIAVNFVFRVIYAFPPQQSFCPDAVGAGLPSIDFHIGFDSIGFAAQDGIEKVKHFQYRGKTRTGLGIILVKIF